MKKHKITKLKINLILLHSFFFFYINVNAQVENLSIDPSEIPFCRSGSYLSMVVKNAPNEKNPSLNFWDNGGRRMWEWKGVFKIEAIKDGKVVPATYTANASKLTMKTPDGLVEFAYEDTNTIRIKGKGIALRLSQGVKDWSSYSFPTSATKNQWRVQMGGYDHYIFTGLKGKVNADPARSEAGTPPPARPQMIIDLLPNEDGIIEAAFEQYNTAWKIREYSKPFEACVKESQKDYESFLNGMPPSPAHLSSSRSTASYIKWSTMVYPKGLIKRPTMLCSKNTMSAVWSWDNCFSALANSFFNMDYAVNQLLVMLDHQTPTGAIPNYLTEQSTLWGFSAPPIHGLAILKMEEFAKNEISIDHLKMLYDPIAKYTDFWFTYNDDDGNGIPQYHHANDSGEDNGTVFEIGYPAEGPDLVTYLIFQTEFLSKAAKRLGKTEDENKWNNKTKFLLNHLTTKMWTGDRFITKNALTGEYDKKGKAFLNYHPILLGNRLPEKIKTKLVNDIKTDKNLIRDFGPASEAINSPYFKEDGYWRGAVWAPQVYFLCIGMKECGEPEFAKKIADNYTKLCMNSTFPENFSALTGKPLRDSGYSWTSDVFLLLAYEFLYKK